VERRAEPGAARAQDEDVELEDVQRGSGGAPVPVSAVKGARPRSDAQAFVPSALPSNRPSRPTMNTVGVAVTSYCWVTLPSGSSRTVNVVRWSETQAATRSRGSWIEIATTASPRSPNSRLTCSMDEGNSLVQYPHQVAQK
jgi:hypothetical protein